MLFFFMQARLSCSQGRSTLRAMTTFYENREFCHTFYNQGSEKPDVLFKNVAGFFAFCLFLAGLLMFLNIMENFLQNSFF
jgi:hypothetical protein